MLVIQQPVNGSAVAPRQVLQPNQQQQQHSMANVLEAHSTPLSPTSLQDYTSPLSMSLQQNRLSNQSGPFLQGLNEPCHPLQSQVQDHPQIQVPSKVQHSEDKSSLPWMGNDFPPLPSSRPSPAMNPSLLTQSFNSIHPLQQQQQQHARTSVPSPGSFHSQQQQQQQHLLQQQQQQQYNLHTDMLLSQQQYQQQQPYPGQAHAQQYQGSDLVHMSPNSAMSMEASPNTGYAQHFQGLNQDSPMAYDHGRWPDQNKGHTSDMFHIASPPLTPSGTMARSPNSFNSFGMNNANVKRPPLWPMDRTPVMPFPRQPMTPSQSSKAANLQHIPCKFFKSGACTAGKNCLFSHSRDPPSENHVCKYFLKGNCKFGAKCSLSHSFLALDRKTSALLPNNGGRARLERRASSGAILNNLWPAEPLSPPYGSLPQQQSMAMQHPMDFGMGRSPSQQGFLKPVLNRATSESLRNALYHPSPRDFQGHRSPFSEDDSQGTESSSSFERFPTSSLSLLESRTRQHLAAPLPIRQRSLPDIFRLAPVSSEGSTLASSPFYHAGNKALFLSVSCESDTLPSSPLRLHSIPELHDLYSGGQNGTEWLRRRNSSTGMEESKQSDDYSDSDDDLSSDQGYLPSSLNDLLTTGERQRRQSRQEDIESRPIMLPSPASGTFQEDKDEGFTFGMSSLSLSLE